MKRFGCVAAVWAVAVLAGCASGPLGARPVVSSPSEGGEGRDNITLSFQLADEDLTAATVLVEYTTDGVTWLPTTLSGASAGVAAGSTVTGLRPANAGAPITCIVWWDSWADGVAVADATPVPVSIRLTPSDIDGVGAPVVIPFFPINNYYPELSIDTSVVRFTTDLLTMGVENHQDPPSETIQITNTGPATPLSWTSNVTYDSGNPVVGPQWLILSPASGGVGSVQLDADVRGLVTTVALDAGTYTAWVEIDAGSAHASPQTVTVVLDVRKARADLFVNKTDLVEFVCVEGFPPAPGDQTFTIDNTGESGTGLMWTVSENVTWLTCNPTFNSIALLVGDPPETVTVSVVSPLTLPAGRYATTIAVSGVGDDGEPILGTSRTVGASLWVKVPPQIGLTPPSLSFLNATEGLLEANPAFQDVTLTNSGEVDLVWDVSAVTYSPNGSGWLSVDISSGTVLCDDNAPVPPDSDTIRFTVDSQSAGGLTADTYTATVTFRDTVYTTITSDVNVTLKVRTRATLERSPASFVFNTRQNVSNPPGQTLSIWNNGETPLNWSVSEGATWLTLTNISSPPCSSETDQVMVSVVDTSLPIGSYNATITISDVDATPPSITALVTLNILPNVFIEDFETGFLQGYWTTSSTTYGRIQVSTLNLPHGGSYHLLMDSSTSGGADDLNEATLTVDLAGWSGVTLSFWTKDFNDEYDPMVSSFVGSTSGDGVSISEDGITWYTVLGAAGDWGTAAWQQYVINLDAACAAYGISYNSTFRIRFQQYDEFSISTDGRAFDDIVIQ